MGGHWEVIGQHKTFIPPFVNERFDGPPFWACTYTALLLGANVGYLGRLPATHAEIRKLAKASGDKDLRGGSRASHMITAMNRRYGESVHLDNVGPREARRRLGSGWAMVCGVTYGELPTRYRRWSPRFKLGHRMLVLGFSGSRTRLVDPMAAKADGFAGEWIAWDDFAAAWWRQEQLWFWEGQFVGKRPPVGAQPAAAPKPPPPAAPKPPPAPPPAAPAKPAAAPAAAAAAAATAASDVPVVRVLMRFDSPRHFRVTAGTTVRAYRPARPKPILVREIHFPHPSGALFDALVTFDPAASLADTAKVYLRVTKGAFADRFVPWSTPGVVADTGAEAAVTVAAAMPKDELEKVRLDAKREEYERIASHLLNKENMPPPPEA